MSERAGSLPLVGGALCLDFCNTVSGVGTPERVEHLGSLEDLASWAVHAGLLSGAEARKLSRQGPPPGGGDALAKALGARTVLQELFGSITRGAAPRPSTLSAFNGLLKESTADGAVVPAGDGFDWAYSEPKGSLASVLNPILRSAAETLVDRDLHRLKACPGHVCGWLFHDDTKNANRVWCEMRVCGSRAKARQRGGRRLSPGASAAA